MTQGLPEAVRAALLPFARAGRSVTYRDLAALVPVPPPHGIHKLTLALEELVREDHAAGRPLIAALAVSRVAGAIPGQCVPGRGFFMLLSELGRYAGPDRGPEAARAHAAELSAALAYWGSVTRVPPEAGTAPDGPGRRAPDGPGRRAPDGPGRRAPDGTGARRDLRERASMTDILAAKRFPSPPDPDSVAQDWRGRGYSCHRFVDPPGQRWEDFAHTCNEVVTVLEGRLELEVSGSIVTANPGDEVFIPKGARHSVRNIHSGASVWLFGYD